MDCSTITTFSRANWKIWTTSLAPHIWSDIDLSILGTLFERVLDPAKRGHLGAHYTDRDKIMQIVNPVIVEPLLNEWAEVKAQIEDLIENAPKANQ